MARDGEIIQKQPFFVITETQFAILSQDTQRPNSTERLHVDATIMRCFRQSYFHVSYRRRMLAMLISPGKALTVHAKLQI